MYNIEKTKEIEEKGDLALLEDLELRFGPAMAQQIMDQLKKVEKPKKVATADFEYLGVKALSEAAEMYRREARTALKRYQDWKDGCGTDLEGVVDMEGAFLKKEFQRCFDFYRRFNKGFFIVYRQAMQTYKTEKVRLNKTSETTTVSMAA